MPRKTKYTKTLTRDLDAALPSMQKGLAPLLSTLLLAKTPRGATGTLGGSLRIRHTLPGNTLLTYDAPYASHVDRNTGFFTNELPRLDLIAGEMANKNLNRALRRRR